MYMEWINGTSSKTLCYEKKVSAIFLQSIYFNKLIIK